jgi:hypothetical protein
MRAGQLACPFAAQVPWGSKIFCFEIDGRLFAEMTEVSGEPFVGPISAYLVKMA